MDLILDIKNLTKSFGSKRAVGGISFGARIFSRGLLQFDRTLSFGEIGRMMRKEY
ncbi:MAG: hypothetical protein PHP20_06595 [Firmicutes bacterium]|jgi:hypothetical protein|nr:hypothetical protein [Bacillota bacterium]MDD4792719.1 hypothetical protein [Bacillota bacterium]